MNSFQDSRGMLFIDCSECNLGGNGMAACSAGWTVTKPKRGGCFAGNLLERFLPKAIESNESPNEVEAD